MGALTHCGCTRMSSPFTPGRFVTALRCYLPLYSKRTQNKNPKILLVSRVFFDVYIVVRPEKAHITI